MQQNRAYSEGSEVPHHKYRCTINGAPHQTSTTLSDDSGNAHPNTSIPNPGTTVIATGAKGDNGSGNQHHKLDGNGRNGRGIYDASDDAEATRIVWNDYNKTEPRGPYERAMIDWLRREMGSTDDDELAFDMWLFLRSHQPNDFITFNEAIEDFYAYIEHLEMRGVSNLCSRVGAFIAAEDTLGVGHEGQSTHQQRDALNPNTQPSSTSTPLPHQHNQEQINNHTMAQAHETNENKDARRPSNHHHGDEVMENMTERLWDNGNERGKPPPPTPTGLDNCQPGKRRGRITIMHNCQPIYHQLNHHRPI